MIISATHNNDDPWEGVQSNILGGERELERPTLRITIIDGVEPLDAQFGVFPKKTVPNALYGVLFGQSQIATSKMSGIPASTPILTYAILDAAKIVNLPELLDSSGLEYRCLFKGEAYDNLKYVAPWIVLLDDSNDFTRKLFTRSGSPWHLWDIEPGIYIRSPASLDDMCRHFRKFTRIQDESGKWYYLRFWDKSVLNAARRGGFGAADFYQKLTSGVAIIWRNPEPEMPNRFLRMAWGDE